MLKCFRGVRRERDVRPGVAADVHACIHPCVQSLQLIGNVLDPARIHKPIGPFKMIGLQYRCQLHGNLRPRHARGHFATSRQIVKGERNDRMRNEREILRRLGVNLLDRRIRIMGRLRGQHRRRKRHYCTRRYPAAFRQSHPDSHPSLRSVASVIPQPGNGLGMDEGRTRRFHARLGRHPMKIEPVERYDCRDCAFVVGHAEARFLLPGMLLPALACPVAAGRQMLFGETGVATPGEGREPE